MMPLHLGAQRIARLYRGAVPIARACRGATKLFDRTHLPETVFTDTLNADTGGGWSGWTIRQVLPASLLAVPDFSPSEIRIAVQGAAAEGFHFASWHVGNRAASGSPWHAAALFPILWSGNADGTIPQSGSLVSDWASFSWDRESDLVFSVYCNGAGDTMRQNSVSAAGSNYYYRNANEASAAAPNGYTAQPDRRVMIAAIEMK